jgi:hypothetical protein
MGVAWAASSRANESSAGSRTRVWMLEYMRECVLACVCAYLRMRVCMHARHNGSYAVEHAYMCISSFSTTSACLRACTSLSKYVHACMHACM